MNMTHYMELLASNQPWNLIIFMAIPVILAETVAITELYILYTNNSSGKVGLLSKGAWILWGFYFLWVFIYLLFNAVIPITISWTWRGIWDMIAVWFYLLGVIPLIGIALVDMGILWKSQDKRISLKLHAIFVGIFLVFAHIAMIFGMLSPWVLWYQEMPMHQEQNMNM